MTESEEILKIYFFSKSKMTIPENILKNIEKIYQQKYGVAVFDVKIENVKDGIEIKGNVLTENQRDYIMNALKKNKIKIKKEKLKILSDASARNEIGWAVVKNKITDLKLRFVSSEIINEKILKRIRCSQAFQEDILRVLFKKENQLLVQQNDLTLGWVDRKGVILKKKSLYKKWASGNFALKGKIIKTSISKNKIIKEAEKFLGVKYVLGGKSEKGIDCSGLTQIVYKNSLDIILPRHSWDQRKVGKRNQKEVGKKVNLKNVKSGDLVFLVKKSNQHKHVGIVEIIKSPQSLSETATGRKKNKSVNLIHASLDRKKVVRQSLEEVFEEYDFVEARRVVELNLHSKE